MVKYINKLNLKILKYASLGRCFNHPNFNFGFNLKSFKMLKLNEKYVINNGQGSIVFTEGNKGTVNAVYTIRGNKSEGKINGTLDDNLLKGTFHVDAAAGLIEFTFSDAGFDAKWKQGLEPGPMRGKWLGSLEQLIDLNKQLPETNKQQIQFFLEINSVEEYRINYGNFYAELEVDESTFEDFINECNYSSLVKIINEALNNNIGFILSTASTEIDLEELKEDEYDWFYLSPNIRVLAIGDVDISSIYNVYNSVSGYESDAAELLAVDESEVEEYVTDFMTDIAFHFDKQMFLDNLE